MLDKNNKQHKENLDFIAKSLANKPVTADLFRQIIEFNSKNLVPVEINFPKRKVPNIEFIKELSNNVIAENFTKDDFEMFVSDISGDYY